VVGDSVYASGNTIYKYTDCPILELATNDRATSPWLVPHDVLRATGGQVAFTIELPVGARRLHVAIYDRFAIKVRTVVDDDAPAPGTRKVIWDLADDRGRRLPGGTYGLRASYDGCSASRMILVESGDVDAVATASGGTAARPSSGFTMPYRLRGG
jgi:flagellar hook assembly protein FlgD